MKLNLHKFVQDKLKKAISGDEGSKYFMQAFVDHTAGRREMEEIIDESKLAEKYSLKETKNNLIKKSSLQESLHYIDNSFLGTRLQDVNSYGKMITGIKKRPLKAIAGGAYLGLAGYGLAKTIDDKDKHNYSGLDAFNAMAGVTPYFAWRGITN